MERRAWLGRVARGGLGAGGALALSGALADDAAPERDDLDAALGRFGADDAAADPRLVVDVAADAWSGAFVMVRVDASALDGVRVLHLLRDDHGPATIASLEPRGALPARLSLTIRLERPCRLHALARTANGWVRAEATVATVGAPGCG